MDNLFQMWWPVACVVLADVIYQVCAKKISSRADPLAALGVTYLVSAAVCVGLYYEFVCRYVPCRAGSSGDRLCSDRA